MTMLLDTQRYGNAIARAVRICVDAEVMDFNGHVSCRDESSPGIIWINDRESSRSTLTDIDVCAYDLATAKRVGVGVDPPLEHWLHREIYLRRPDVNAIVHAHPEFALTLSSCGIPLAPASAIGTFLPENGAPVFDSAVLINSEQRGSAVAAALGDESALELRQHGMLTVGSSIAEAAVRLICAEANARIICRAGGMGEIRWIRGSEFDVLSKENWTSGAIKKYWRYYEERAERRGTLDGLQLIVR